jgi:hypothetical protein
MEVGTSREVSMNHLKLSDVREDAAANQDSVKKPYEKPRVRFERVFETMAMSCGKVQATQGSCRANRKAS